MENIKLDKIVNMRDLGGLSNDEFIVRDKQFIRSGNINELSDNDINILKNEYGLRTVIDLRNDSEKKSFPDVIIPGVKYYHIPLLAEKTEGITRESSTPKSNIEKVPNMAELYLQIVRNYNSCRQIKKVLKLIMKDKNRCVLFHCSVGKDRTGIIAMLVLSMLGIDMDTIMKDYLYTNVVNREEAEKNYKFLYEKTHDKKFAEQCRDVYLAKEDYLMAAVDYLEDEYGSVNDYIVYGLGIKLKNIDKFRERCLIKKD